MSKTLIVTLLAGLAAFGLGGASPAYASSHTTLDADNQVMAAQALDGGAALEPLNRPAEPPRPRGMGNSIFPLILLIPLGWILFRSLSRRRGNPDDVDPQGPARPSQGRDAYSQDNDPENLKDAYRHARATWDYMTSEPNGSKAAAAVKDVAGQGGFDKTEFLHGAKLAYVRLSEAFDRLDADAAAPFASQAVLDGLRARAASGAEPVNTEIVLVDADLLEHTAENGRDEAVVLYDVLLRRGPDAREPEQVKQVWRFVRHDVNDMWKLDRMEAYTEAQTDKE
ncbi:MAG: Tim44-like domain-containing protein [Desulfovibrionaceae bacterium]